MISHHSSKALYLSYNWLPLVDSFSNRDIHKLGNWAHVRVSQTCDVSLSMTLLTSQMTSVWKISRGARLGLSGCAWAVGKTGRGGRDCCLFFLSGWDARAMVCCDSSSFGGERENLITTLLFTIFNYFQRCHFWQGIPPHICCKKIIFFQYGAFLNERKAA